MYDVFSTAGLGVAASAVADGPVCGEEVLVRAWSSVRTGAPTHQHCA